MSEDDICRIISTAPRRYKIYTIPKRSGSEHRIIAQPARELKAIQRFLISEKLSSLPVHPIATAYKPKINILNNAMPHARKRVLLKLDFESFFHSIEPRDLQSLLRNSGLTTIQGEDRQILTNILFWKNPFTGKLCLSIGAPSSPFISNAVMEPIDRELIKIARSCSAACTRYADDITLSANSIENLERAEVSIRKLIAKTKTPRLRFNESKRGIFTSAGRKIVTGLVLTPEGRVSLGRERKRKISSALHHISVERNVSPEKKQMIRGWLAYAQSVEPVFVERMKKKYPLVVDNLIKMPFEKRMSFVS
ncbi:MAG: retron St85 family RNA-directed DNA polymerase [Pseudolabrys sp.]|nr:retron St85 family RNA-directed DNA polymerase [Pseudolabrys sp.]